MNPVEGAAALIVIVSILWDAFETIVLPRRVSRRLRLARLYVRLSWGIWSRVAQAFPRGSERKNELLGLYGPLAALGLVVMWAAGVVLGFGLLFIALGPSAVSSTQESTMGPLTLLYLSGTTFFTLGLGDVLPTAGPSRAAVVLEGGLGFTFLALVIAYIPPLFSTFTEREADITLLDARAGSPPTAFELLRRHARWNAGDPLIDLLREWETWTAALLTGYLAYPLLAYFRSQHQGQSWLGSVTVILDTCALLVVGVDQQGQRVQAEQARLTFAMARHAVGDLSQVLDTPPRSSALDRLPPERLTLLRSRLVAHGLRLREGPRADEQLNQLRGLYEPYVIALSHKLLLPLPPWLPADDAVDDWETTAWAYDPQVARRAMETLD